MLWVLGAALLTSVLAQADKKKNVGIVCPKNLWDVMGPQGCYERRVWCFHRRLQDS